jgi:hypothetical protein
LLFLGAQHDALAQFLEMDGDHRCVDDCALSRTLAD